MVSEKISDGIPDELKINMQLEAIFTPQLRQKREDAYKIHLESITADRYARFVHYTSAEAALNIIQNKQLWLRNTNCMSDFREIEHGFDLLRKCFGDEVKRKLFTEILDTCAPGATNKAIELFDQHLTNIRSSTYIASISEHKSEEDLHGRLSMWRAYCGDAGRVAIVFKVPWHTDKLVMGIDALNIRFGPVVYIGENEFDSIFQQIMFNINESQDFLRFAGFDRISNSIFNMLFMSTLCTKHSGFQEEQEWRIIYCPPVWKPTLKQIEKNLMKSERKVIGGVPQKIIIMPLNGEVDDVLEHFDLAYMFDRLIIGPTQYGWPMLEAFKDALQDIGVEDAHQKVFLSNIPLRT